MINRDLVGNRFPVRPLSAVCEFLDHLRRPVTESDRVAGPYPYYGANGQQGTMSKYLFDEPLVLLAEDGGHFDNPGRGIAYRIEGKTWVNNHAHVLRPKSGIEVGYLARVLEHYDVSPFVTGTTRGKLTKAGASIIPIPVPPQGEQRRIAAILDQAEALRAKRRQALSKLDTLTQSLFLEMFGDPACNPMKWPIAQIGDLLRSCDYGSSSKAGTKGAFPMLRMNNLTAVGRMYLDDLKFVDLPSGHEERWLVRPGDILFNRTNSAELVGKTAVVRTDRPMAYAGYLVRGRVNQRSSPEYISTFLNSRYGKATLRGMCKSIIGMANINATEFRSIRIPVPPIALQEFFSSKCLAVEGQRVEISKHLMVLEKLASSLEYRAFRGEL